jgi:hypothetical protein
VSDSSKANHPLAALPRTWWFPNIPGYRSGQVGTYARFDLDDQPSVPASGKDLDWLGEEDEKPEWSIDQTDGGQSRPLSIFSLEAVSGGLELSASLLSLAARPDLQRRIRSSTACYLDLGDFRVPTTIEGGYLVHVLSDQQWCRHWLLYVDAAGNEAMVTTIEPFGFELPEDQPPPPPTVPIDGTGDLEVCADSFSEFLYRFWVENELWHAVADGVPLPPRVAAYAAQLPGSGSARGA